MTVIVAVEHKTGVTIGADSYVGVDNWRDLTDRPKWTRHGSVVIALAGDVRAATITETLPPFRARRRREDAYTYIADAVVEPMRNAHKALDADVDDVEGIIVYSGAAYTLLAYSLNHSPHGYAATGAGQDYALGALAATSAMPPRKRVELAMRAALRHSSMVAEPFRILDVPRR